MTQDDSATNSLLHDIAGQPDALLMQASASLSSNFQRLDFRGFDRIVLTGMGSSLYSFIPVERALAARGLPVLRLDAGQLLDVPARITPGTLLWATSQSGRSGELVALLDRLRGVGRPRTIVATTDDTESPLAQSADIVVELRSGPEATVSTKSYLNTLAAHLRTLAAIADDDLAAIDADVHRTAAELRKLLADMPIPTELVAHSLADPRPRFAFVGAGDDAATALTGALITKEASKVAAEGYVGGSFRHGPMELAGSGLTAILFGRGRKADKVLPSLARDLLDSGSRVVTVGPAAYAGTRHLPTPVGGSLLQRLVFGIVRVQLLTIALARATGEVPGEFRFGRKITDIL